MNLPPLIICGSIAIDRLMSFSGKYSDMIHADKLDVLSLSILVEQLEIAQGGVGANITSNAAQLGLSSVLLGSIGIDGKDYVRHLADRGVNTDYVHHSDLPSANFTVITDSSNNQVGGFYPGAMADSASLTLEPWKESDAVVCLSAQDGEAMRRQVQECKDFGLTLLYDPGQQTNNISGDDLKAGCEAADLVFVNEYELDLLTSKTGISAEQLKADTDIFITTLGSKGSLIEGSKIDKPITVPAAKPDKVEDPSGAGDAFRAGFLYGFIRQWETLKCVQLGTVVASFIVEEVGPQQAFTVAGVKDRFKLEFNEELELI